MKNPRFSRATLLSGIAFLSASMLSAFSDVKMPAIFGDHMVLQQSTKLPVWGWAAPGEKVTVTVGSNSGSAVAGQDGSWRVDLAPLALADNDAPQTMTVAGTNTITYQDVLIGDVWVDSGQSNMEFGIGMLEHPADVAAKANLPLLRLFCVPNVSAMTPQKDITIPPGNGMIGKWEVCSPTTIQNVGPAGGFSAVGYFFGQAIQQATGHPVGMITCAWGGTPAEGWTPIAGLRKAPQLAHYVTDYDKLAANYTQAEAAYPKLKADYQAEDAKWQTEVGAVFNPKWQEWLKEDQDSQAHHRPSPPRPQPSRPEPQPPQEPDGGSQSPCVLFNGVVAPIIPYAMKGVVWYQGESNGNTTQRGEEYNVLFPQMIKEWRTEWAEGDFPFLYVQLASFGAPATTPTDGTWPYVREAQLKTLALPNTGMASAIDIGDPFNIHPKDKLDVGKRLALAAQHVAYGKDLVYSGPLYDSEQIDGDKITISLKSVGSGLTIAPPLWVPNGATIPQPTELTGFAIAGADRNWVWAKAEIQGDKVILSSDKVPAPMAVRYGWNMTPPVDLYNKEGLPASPFRTDNWD